MLKNKKTILVIAIILALVGVFIWILLSGEAETKRIRRNDGESSDI